MEDDLRGIGQMARESGLTVSALRFYDGAGLLAPAEVDPVSGYRRYGREQVADARLLASLRRVGLPLTDIRQVLAHPADRRRADEVLAAHLRRLEDGLAAARRELSAAHALLDLRETPMSPAPTRATTTAAELRRALRCVRFAVGADPELPVLAGVLLELDAAAVRVVATDRHRLALAEAPTSGLDGPPVTALAPVALVDDALALLGDQDGPAAVVVQDDEVHVQAAGSTLRSPVLDLEFPDYRRVLPTGARHRIDVDAAVLRRELVGAATRTSPSATQAAVLTLDADGGWGFGGGLAPQLEVGLDREYLLQALDAAPTRQLVLELDGPIAPLALRAADDDRLLSLLMPVRLD